MITGRRRRRSSAAGTGAKSRGVSPAPRWMARRLYKRCRRRVPFSACYALVARASVMAARVRLKMQCGTSAALPFFFLVIVCSVDAVCGMFEHKGCDHRPPRPHEVSPQVAYQLTSPIAFLPVFRVTRPSSSTTTVASLKPFGKRL